MKIKNISKKAISIPFKVKDKKTIILSLEPGQVVYCEEKANENNAIIVFKRKNKIELTEEDKPKNGEYYHVYGVLSHSEVLKLKQQEVPKIISLDIEDDEDDDELPEVSIIEHSSDIDETSDDDEDVDEIDINIDTDETSDDATVSKVKKGGRPKGVKNKSKK